MTRQQLLEKGWKRHSIISPTNGGLPTILQRTPLKIQSLAAETGAVLITATYDCAVVHDCFEEEPWVQLLVATPVGFNKQLSKGRNPRRIHFNMMVDGSPQAFEICAAGICQIDRGLLLEIEPDNGYEIDDNEKHFLKNWAGERFRLDTWPDTFNEAIKRREKALKKFWGRYNDFLSAMYLRLNTYEELTDDKYSAAVILAIEEGRERGLIRFVRDRYPHLKEGTPAEIKEHIASEALTVFDGAIDITLDPTRENKPSIEVLGEESITVAMQKKFSLFSPYSLSEPSEEHPVPAEMTSAKSN